MPSVKDVVVNKPSEDQIAKCKIWPIWTCEASIFEWEYSQTEKCYLLEGKVTVTDNPEGAESITFRAGELVELPAGLKCIWKVEEAVKKHYDFV